MKTPDHNRRFLPSPIANVWYLGLTPAQTPAHFPLWLHEPMIIMANPKQIELLNRIEIHPMMFFGGHNPNAISRLDKISDELYSEVGWLFEKYPYLGIFENPPNSGLPYSRNGWRLSSSTLDFTLAEGFMGAERVGDRGDYMWNYIDCGSSLNDGGVGICCAPENFGKIAFCTVNANSERGDIPIVANTFTEWIERTLDAGPDASCPYWEMPDFIDLGPAIPGDPTYRPIGRH